MQATTHYKEEGAAVRLGSAERMVVQENPSFSTAPRDNGMEAGMGLLIDRLDRLHDSLQRHSAGHFMRVYPALDIANPAPLGFFAFSLATCLYMTSQAGITEASTQFMAFPLGIFFGGLAMLIVAVLEAFRRNALGTAAFGTFSSFWIAIGVYGIVRASGVFFLDSPKGQEAVTALFGVAAVGFAVVSVAINLVLPILFLCIAVMFFLLSAGTQRPDIGKAAGWFGIVPTSTLAYYTGLAVLFEEMWGKEVLPLFYTKIYKKHAKQLFPRISVHDPLSVGAGVPYEGRPEVRRGDNLSAMGPTPSLMGSPGAAKPPAAMV